MSMSFSISHAAAGVTRQRDLVRMLINSLFWAVLGVVVAALAVWWLKGEGFGGIAPPVGRSEPAPVPAAALPAIRSQDGPANAADRVQVEAPPPTPEPAVAPAPAAPAGQSTPLPAAGGGVAGGGCGLR